MTSDRLIIVIDDKLLHTGCGEWLHEYKLFIPRNHKTEIITDPDQISNLTKHLQEVDIRTHFNHECWHVMADSGLRCGNPIIENNYCVDHVPADVDNFNEEKQYIEKDKKMGKVDKTLCLSLVEKKYGSYDNETSSQYWHTMTMNGSSKVWEYYQQRLQDY